MANILLTGASGLLGVNFLMEAAQQHSITGVVHSRAFTLDGVHIVQADLTQPGTAAHLIENTRPDWVIHSAALADVDACEKQPELARRLNAELPGELAAAAEQAGARFLHISTDAVFDGQHGGYTEDDAPNPLSVYARSKLDGENAVQGKNPSALIARVNFYGWSINGNRSLAEFFVNNLVDRHPIKGFEDVFVCPSLVNHLALTMIEMLEKGLGGLYHVVSSEPVNKYDFGCRIARQFGLDETLITPISVSHAGLAASRSPLLTLNNAKVVAALGHRLPGIDSGIQRLHELYQQGYPALLQQL